jgi:valyl-tRNA synthetase
MDVLLVFANTPFFPLFLYFCTSNQSNMEIASKYNPAEVEDKWYAYWMKHNLFHSEPDEREPYTIVIPPPNVTGILHMGHMLNNTIQDILVRRARMQGKNACWVPGTDHASIATEAKVVNKLAKEGIKKTDLTRSEFLEHAWEWTHKHGGIILEQLKKLGASCDWDRTCFTMDEKRSESVIKKSIKESSIICAIKLKEKMVMLLWLLRVPKQSWATRLCASIQTILKTNI